MDRDSVDWRGYWVAAPTPFGKDLSLDAEAFRAVLRRYLDQGVHGILVNGTTGEWFSQSQEERRTVAALAVEVVADRVPVVVGCSAYTPGEASSLVAHAGAIGAAGAAATPPPYVHPSELEALEFFRAVAGAAELPFMVYNWPRGVGLDMSVDLIRRLAELPNVVAVKDSTGDEWKCARACEAVADRVRFFGRFIHRLGMAVYREIGGDGNIDGGGLGAPFAVPYFESLWKGDLETAREHGRAYASLVAELVREDYSARFASPTAQLKAAMNLLGEQGGRVRPPLLDIVDDGTLAALRAALERGGRQPALRP